MRRLTNPNAHLYHPNTRMLKSKWRVLTGKVKASEVANEEEQARIKKIIKMFNGEVVGVYERKADG